MILFPLVLHSNYLIFSTQNAPEVIVRTEEVEEDKDDKSFWVMKGVQVMKEKNI